MNVNMPVVIAWFDRMLDAAVTHKLRVLGAAALVAAGIGGYHVYRYMDNRAHAAAHQDFMAMLKAFDAAEKPATDGEAWQKLADMAKNFASKHSGTKQKGVFLAYEADALMQLDKTTEALAAMKKAAASMPTAALREYYDLKVSLMMIDATEEAIRTEGLKKLKAMADNPKHAAHAEALYHAGNYAWVAKDFAQAKNYWQQLVIKYANEKNASDHVEKVKSKLELLAV